MKTLSFRSYDSIQSINRLLKNKYNESLELCNQMTARLPHKRPNCEEILERKNSWALIKEQLQINNELIDIINSKERENEFTIYSLLRNKLNSNDFRVSESLGAVTLKRSRSTEQTEGVSQEKRRT